MPNTSDEINIVPADPQHTRDGHSLSYDVRQAAAAILAQGNRPTVAAVRGILGGGNANTINEALNEFYRDVGNQLLAGAGRLPETDLPPAFLEGAKTLYKVAANLASEALSRDRVEAARQVAAAEDTVRAAQLAQDNSEQRLATALKDIQRLEAVGAEREQALAREIVRAAAAERHVVHLQGEMAARDRIAREQAQKFEAKIAHLEKQLAQEGEKVAQERARADRLQNQRDEEARAYRTDTEIAQAQHQHDVEAWAAERQQYLQALTEARKQLQESESARAEARGKLAALTEQTGRLREELAALSADRQRLVAEFAAAQAGIAALEKTVAERHERIGALEQRVAALAEECQRLQVQLARTRVDTETKPD